MIRKAEECQVELREAMRGGPGTVRLTAFVNKEELHNKGRLFSRITLESGCGIGYHVHEGESEIFYIIQGTALYNDNGTEREVSAGDVTICPPGEGHAITNRGDVTVELAALIISE